MLTAPNAVRKSKTGVIVGAAVGAVVVGLIVLTATGLYVWRQKSRKLALEEQGT